MPKKRVDNADSAPTEKVEPRKKPAEITKTVTKRASPRRKKSDVQVPEQNVPVELPSKVLELEQTEQAEQVVQVKKKTTRKRKIQPAPTQNFESEQENVVAPTIPSGVADITAIAIPATKQPKRTQKARKEKVTPQKVTQEETPVAEPVTNTAELRQLLLKTIKEFGRPVGVQELEQQFEQQTTVQLETLLESLVSSGNLVHTRKHTYGLPEAMNLVRGRFQASSGGFGFVIPDTGTADYYIPPEKTLEAWNGDIVLVRADGVHESRRGDAPRATVVRIIERARKQLVGTLEHAKGYAILKADDSRARHRILLLSEDTETLPTGARVLVELFWPETTGEDEVFGRISRLLGETDDPATETQAVIVKFGLRDEFPPEVLAEAEKISNKLTARDLKDRLDLRTHNIFTVDGRDAKDFDDAIHIQSGQNGNFIVGIHIADVSHYVQAGSALDKEAFARATSVYLPGRVLPMLPERLSNGVCSLVPLEDRLTISAIIEVSKDGDVQNVQLTPSVICSQARLTYDEVQDYSEGTATLPEHARKIEGDLHLLLKLTSRMRQKRLREGSLDFKLREVKVDVDSEGNLQLIPLREETARGMIEDLMLLANKAVARYMLTHHAPALYRVHEEPTLGRFSEVSAALARMGIVLGTEPTPQAYQAALKKVSGTPQETVVNTLLLRSLKQAHYTGENRGHFGLAFDEYLHFTSPIRRYPDLIVHRSLRASLAGETHSAASEALRAELPKLGEHTSERERTATEAERDLTKYYQAKWASAHLGETFEGNVTGVTSFGLFVGLHNGVEGLLHISNLDDDYYYFLEDVLMLKGRSNGRTYRLGDTLAVTIAQVNPIGRSIDFIQQSQENDMSENTKPRARKRGEREQERAAERSSRMHERPPRLAALDAQQQAEAANRQRELQETREMHHSNSPNPRTRRPTGRYPTGDRFAPPNNRPVGVRPRRIVTLEHPRNEHNRPVSVTVQRLYFGDWSIDNLTEDEAPAPYRPRHNRPIGGRPNTVQPQTQSPAPKAAGPGPDRRRRRRRRKGSNE